MSAAHARKGRVSYPVTPDGRYFVVRGRLWRYSNPELSLAAKNSLTHDLMEARRSKLRALRAGDIAAANEARLKVDSAKKALGERGEVWWLDGAPDWNRHMAKNTPYASWFERLDEGQSDRRSKGSATKHLRSAVSSERD